MVVDTSVFIEHLRAKNKTQTTLVQLAQYDALSASVLTRFELLCGATSAEKERDVTAILANVHELGLDADVVAKATEIYIALKRRNQLIGPVDILIAATALVHNLPVKTLNTDYFTRVDGLILL